MVEKMEIIKNAAILAFIVVGYAFAYACCKVSSESSRKEEETFECYKQKQNNDENV